MAIDAAKEQLATLKFQANQHEVIRVSDFKTVEEYVLHLMHCSDYETAKLLAHDKTVLDLGCNGGHGTIILGSVCKEITGVDVSPTAIATAKSRHESDKVKFLLVDGLTLPFPDHSFDLITSFQVIEHLGDYEMYFSEIKRVLKSEGLLLITTPNAAIRLHLGQKPWNPFHVREFRASELENLLRSHFEYAHVLGQFAADHTYRVEYNRCISARGSTPSDRALAARIARKLGRMAVDGLRSIKAAFGPKGGKRYPHDFQAEHSIVDFRYGKSAIDNSLSLVGCCSANAGTAAAATSAFLGKT
ncbi:MAG: methyltransferase domain-containing protein [Limnohabitans sp.]